MLKFTEEYIVHYTMYNIRMFPIEGFVVYMYIHIVIVVDTVILFGGVLSSHLGT